MRHHGPVDSTDEEKIHVTCRQQHFRPTLLAWHESRPGAGRFDQGGIQAELRNHCPGSITRTMDAAAWGAELAVGEGGGRIYLVEPTGPFEDDPNFTGKKFPGNPTQSYRSREPLRVIGEVTDWQPHMVEQLQQMKDGLARLRKDRHSGFPNQLIANS